MFLHIFFTHVSASVEEDTLWDASFALDDGEDSVAYGCVFCGVGVRYGRHRKNLVDIDAVVAHGLSGLFYSNRQRQAGCFVGPKEEQVLFDCGVGV